MDTKEIKSTVSNLEKSSDDTTILKLLNILNDGVKPSEKLLRETKVGMAVNKLRSSNNGEISSLVKKMIKTWKEAVQLEKSSKKKPSQPQQSPKGSPTSSGSATPSNKPAAPVAAPKPGSTNIKFHSGPRNPKTDGINTALYDNSTRNASIGALYTALAIEREETGEHILSVAREIESEVYKAEYASK
ncbi:hypothetical protein QCA50_016450 [Cerrena zonata]|uniref:Uncharacterized protein n=1 Tax=Cerrena zonata TaxID=2478898 RepID=A0AAW0FFH6_9APHY